MLGDRISYPSGRIVQYLRDTKGRVRLVQTKSSSAVTTWTNLADTFTYEPFAALKTVRYGNGLSAANDWGNDGRLASRRLFATAAGTNLSWLGYGYDANDNITAITDQIDDTRSVFYGYDANGRLNQTMQTSSTAAAGNGTYSYTAGTNRLASFNGTTPARTFTYDNRGNLAGESRPGPVTASTTYDGYGRLTGYARSDISTLSFAYNGRDDRVSMTGTVGTRRFVYAPDGRVLGEYGLSAADVKAEFIWMQPEVANDNAFGGSDGVGGYAPLAVATPDSTGTVLLNWVHGNHLGVPLMITNASGALAATPNDYLAPGFPGQSKVLADLYYNRYRDFDPTTGRYIQADPIGLEGGQNSYAYAMNNPIRWTDPSGLFLPALIPAVELAVEAAAGVCARFPAACIGGIVGATGPLAGDTPNGSRKPNRVPPNTCPVNPSSPDGDCEKEWDNDRATCRRAWRFVSSQAIAKCYKTAFARYSECLTKGFPTTPLILPPWDPKKRRYVY